MGIIANTMLLGWVHEKARQHEEKKAKRSLPPYDPEKEKPVLHKSICTGETTAGFKDLKTGKYTEMMLVRSDADLKKFMDENGLAQKPETEY